VCNGVRTYPLPRGSLYAYTYYDPRNWTLRIISETSRRRRRRFHRKKTCPEHAQSFVIIISMTRREIFREQKYSFQCCGLCFDKSPANPYGETRCSFCVPKIHLYLSRRRIVFKNSERIRVKTFLERLFTIFVRQ